MRFIYVPEDVASTPADGTVYVNKWWSVHPEKGVSFYTHRTGRARGRDDISPQCNADESTAQILTNKIQPDCLIKQIPVVYLSHVFKYDKKGTKHDRG